jgi:hypothetical protein
MEADGIITPLQNSLSKYDWPQYPVVDGTVTACCHCGVNIRTGAGWSPAPFLLGCFFRDQFP